MDPGPRVVPDAVTGAATARRCPSVASRPDERDDVPNQPRRSQQPAVDVLVFVATPEIGTSEWARLVKPTRAVEEARSHDEHRNVSHHPDANRSFVFVLRPYNYLSTSLTTVIVLTREPAILVSRAMPAEFSRTSGATPSVVMWNADAAGPRQTQEACGYVRPFARIRWDGMAPHTGKALSAKMITAGVSSTRFRDMCHAHAYPAHSRSTGLLTPNPPRFSTCVYTIVVLTSRCPSSSCTVRMS